MCDQPFADFRSPGGLIISKCLKKAIFGKSSLFCVTICGICRNRNYSTRKTPLILNIVVKEFKPSERLSSHVEYFWEGHFNVNPTGVLSQLVVPNGSMELIIHLSDLRCDLYDKSWSQSPDYTLIGMYTRPYEVKFSHTVRVFGIRFKPEGLYTIFGIPASEFTGSFDDMGDVVGREFRDLCHRLKETPESIDRTAMAEEYLYKTYQRNNIRFSYVNRAAEIIRQRDGFITIDELSDESCISARQLEREFKIKLGVSPKFYMRISRMNKVHRLLESGRALDFTRLSHECMYADQAHFIRDFKTFTGASPRVFVKGRNRYIVNA